ncbi:MAG TPA: TIGR00300 family protein [Acidimicrobiales bacterium]|nr:TIGR00300 family protein [Acidimicrobiales bacterium]
MASERVQVEGHIIDSLTLAKVLDTILSAGCDYVIEEVTIGRSADDMSRALVEIQAPDDVVLESLLSELQVHGANRTSTVDATLVTADTDGVLPDGFYSTTNLPTAVRIDGHWVPVATPEMDCGVAVDRGDDTASARTVPMHRVEAGDRIVVGHEGVRVTVPARVGGPGSQFEFMNSDVSSEKPKARLVADVAARIRAAKEAGERVLLVAGPALIHTGTGPHLAALVRGGWIDVLFAGNGFATHDIESNVLGTSLGVSLELGSGVEHGHSNHLRVINEVRRQGSIAAAVESGYISGGVMYECVKAGVPFVLGGSVRDDGPLPDVHTDVVKAADTMRANLDGVGVALMLATTLHAIATGNLLSATVQTFCVDINQAVVTKLADRGSHQALGIVTDVGLFVEELRQQLVPA